MIHAVAGFGRDGHDVGKPVHPAVFVDQRQQAQLLDEIHLVDNQHHRHVTLLEPLKHKPVAMARRFRGLDHEEHQIHFIKHVQGHLDHALVELKLGLVDAGRVEKHHLGAGQMLDAEDPGPGRLRLVRNDGDFLAEDAVQERRLPHVRPAHQRDKPGAVGRGAAHGRSAGDPLGREDGFCLAPGGIRKTVSPSFTNPSRSRARPSSVV